MILGISGKAGSGKDTVADILCKYYGYKKRSFADPIKEIASLGLSLPLEDFYDHEEKEREQDIFISREITQYLLSALQMKFGELPNLNRLEELLHRKSFNSIREFLQWFGTDFCRNNIDQNIWILIAKKNLDPSSLFIFPDVRFENEAKVIHSLSGFNMLITGRDKDLGDASSHVSEKVLSISNFDFVIKNDKCLSSLQDDLLLFHKFRFPEIERI